MSGNLSFLKRQVAAGIIILSIAMLGCSLVNRAEAQEVDGAMQSFHAGDGKQKFNCHLRRFLSKFTLEISTV